MAQKIGIDQWTEQRIISGCRVAFDPRTTAKVETTRSDKNRKPSERKRTKSDEGAHRAPVAEAAE